MRLDSRPTDSKTIADMPDVWTDYASAQTMHKQGHADAAAQLYNRLIEQQKVKEQKPFIWGYFGLGEVYLSQQRFHEAAEQFSKVVAHQPTVMWAHYYLGESYEKLEKREAAIAAYETAASLFEKAHKFKDAIATCRKIAALDSNDAFIFYKLGRLLAIRDNWREAVSAYEKAIHLGHPNAAQAYRNLILLLQRHRQTQKALTLARELIALEPNFYWNYGILADLLFARRKRTQAISFYEKAVDVQLEATKPSLAYRSWKKLPNRERQVNFFILGFAKTATTSLYEYLIQHPQILPPYRKEPHFFSQHPHYGMDWYLSQFPSLPAPQSVTQKYITGEGSINYIENRQAPARILKTFPQAKFFIVLREPVARTLSDYNMWLRDGRENRSLEQVVEYELSKLSNCTPAQLETGKHWYPPNRQGFISSYLLRSLYLYHIKRWMQVFPREQFFILETQQLAKTPQQTMSQVFDFLELPDCKDISYRQHNQSSYYRESPLNKKLEDFFRPHSEQLEAFLNTSFNWGK